VGFTVVTVQILMLILIIMIFFGFLIVYCDIIFFPFCKEILKSLCIGHLVGNRF